MFCKSIYYVSNIGEIMMKENTKVKRTLTIVHMRDGKVLQVVKPYSDATLIEKVLYWCGLKNLTREL